MLQEENTWSVDVYDDIFDPPPNVPCCNINTRQISIGDVETINGIDYKIVLRDNNPSCLLREENGIVYKYDTQNSEERVLIDMTLELGDVFNLIGSGYDTLFNCVDGGWLLENQLTVEQIETVDIAGMLRKVITFSEYNNYIQLQWIEGIGNISGFDMLWEFVDITGGSLLVCFSNSANTYFFNGATSCDNTTLGLNDLSTEEIILAPNPVTNSSILQLPSEASVDQIKIYDLNGRIIKDKAINKDYFTINAMNYRSGLYFYQVFSQEKLLKTEKFIIK